MMEKWKDITGYEGYYQVSDRGRVKSLDRIIKTTVKTRNVLIKGRVLKFKKHNYGYQMVTLCKDWNRSYFCVHHLVLEAFYGERPDGMECCHNDSNPKNNNIDNLRWDTRAGNCSDKLENGTLVRGEDCNFSKLTEIDVKFIRYWLRCGYTQKAIASAFDITPSNVGYIKRGLTWACVE